MSEAPSCNCLGCQVHEAINHWRGRLNRAEERLGGELLMHDRTMTELRRAESKLASEWRLDPVQERQARCGAWDQGYNTGRWDEERSLIDDACSPNPYRDDPPAAAAECICRRLRDTGGYRIAGLCCPVHGARGTDPGDGYWDAAAEPEPEGASE